MKEERGCGEAQPQHTEMTYAFDSWAILELDRAAAGLRHSRAPSVPLTRHSAG